MKTTYALEYREGGAPQQLKLPEKAGFPMPTVGDEIAIHMEGKDQTAKVTHWRYEFKTDRKGKPKSIHIVFVLALASASAPDDDVLSDG